MRFLRLGLALVCLLYLRIEATEANREENPCYEYSLLPCDNGDCVDRSWWCDGQHVDCGDGSDEAYCKTTIWDATVSNRCKETHFLCDNGRCVPGVAKCDGYYDCKDRSDEFYCGPDTTGNYVTSYITETTSEFTTEDTTTESYFESSSLENEDLHTTTTTQREENPCPEAYLPCDNGECLRRGWWCDGQADCKDASDEAYCEKKSWFYRDPNSCDNTHFLCSDGRCVPRIARCDGYSNCRDGSDEVNCEPVNYITSYIPETTSEFTTEATTTESYFESSSLENEDLHTPTTTQGFTQSAPLGSSTVDFYAKIIDENSDKLRGVRRKLHRGLKILTAALAREGVLRDKLAKRKLVNWFMGQRKNGTQTKKWGHDLPRIAVALFLAEKDLFTPGNKTMEEMNYELTIRLLSQMANGGDLRRRDLSLYIHAMIASCVDPRNFNGRDLVSELRALVEATNGTAIRPFELLVLCNAGDAMSDKDVDRIVTVFYSQHRPFWTDNQTMATLALACVSGHPSVTVDERTLLDMTQELKKRQFRNGTVGNLKTTALVVQALIGTQSLERDFDMSAAIQVILHAQKEDGSVGSFLDSYYVLPVLSNSSLLNIRSAHCKRPTTSESEELSELLGSRGPRLSTQFSVWIGTEVDLRRTWTLKVPANSSLYNILETVQKLDSRQQVEYNVIDGKPYVSSLMGIQDDVETGFYWFTYLRTQSTEDTKLVEESPVDVKIRANQELILWYKSGQWNKQTTPETLVPET